MYKNDTRNGEKMSSNALRAEEKYENSHVSWLIQYLH